MIKTVKIKDKVIGEGNPTLIIAEIACAHQGDIENACELVKIAGKANVDAIQIQVFKKESYMNSSYKDYDLITKLELTQEEWLKVINLIKETDTLFFAAGYDVESIRFLLKNNIDAFKVHSSDTSNPEVLMEVANSGKPIFLSCGASKIEEIKKAINFLRKNGTTEIILMHGYQAFPTKIEDTHLNFIRSLKRLFELNVGFYDHVDGGSILAKIIPVMAIGFGAQIIEKHFILDRKEKGIDYESSLDPENFLEFVKCVRKSEKAIGQKIIRNFTEGEKNYRFYCKKSIVASMNIPKGNEITRENVIFVRSNPGIPPDQFKKIEGKIAKRNIEKYYNITNEDF